MKKASTKSEDYMAQTGTIKNSSVEYNGKNKVNLSEYLPFSHRVSLKTYSLKIMASGRNFGDKNSTCEKNPSEDYSLNYNEKICELKKDGNLPEDGVINHNLNDPKSFYAPHNTIPKDRKKAAANVAHSIQKLKKAFGEKMANRIIKEGKIDPRSNELRKIVDLVDLNYFNPRQLVMLLNMMGDTPAANRLYYGIENNKENPEKNDIQPDCLRTSFTLASMFVGKARQFDLSNIYNTYGNRRSEGDSSSENTAKNNKIEFIGKFKNIVDALKGIFKQELIGEAEQFPDQIDLVLEHLLTFRDINYTPVSINSLMPINSSGKAKFRNPKGDFIYRPGDVIHLPLPKPVYPYDDLNKPNDGPMKAQQKAESMGYDTGPRIGLKTPPFHCMLVVGINAQTGEPLIWSIDGANSYAPGNIIPLSFLTNTTIAANSPAILMRNASLKSRVKN